MCVLNMCTRNIIDLVVSFMETQALPSLESMVVKLKSDYPELVLRFALVGYRDYLKSREKRKDQYVILDFVEDFQTFKKFAESQVGTASDNYGAPDDVLGGLHKVPADL